MYEEDNNEEEGTVEDEDSGQSQVVGRDYEEVEDDSH